MLLSGNNGLKFLLLSVYDASKPTQKNLMWECGIDQPMIEKQLKIFILYLRALSEVFFNFCTFRRF